MGVDKVNNLTPTETPAETDSCPYCSGTNHALWALEFGFAVVRCGDCGLLFVSPKPSREVVDEAVRSGLHNTLGLNVRSRRIPRKIVRCRKIFRSLFSDLWRLGKPITWVDVGCGYGEVLESAYSVAPKGSLIFGYEPMKAKAEKAASLGLNVTNDYLAPHSIEADVISVVNIFSHIPDFHAFIDVVATNLKSNGLLYVETGNLADLNDRADFPGELGVPDYLVFAGEKHIRGYLHRDGFDIERIEYVRIDGFYEFCKNVVKRFAGEAVPFVVSLFLEVSADTCSCATS
jgi:SAM-dependent methyltransferase